MSLDPITSAYYLICLISASSKQLHPTRQVSSISDNDRLAMLQAMARSMQERRARPRNKPLYFSDDALGARKRVVATTRELLEDMVQRRRERDAVYERYKAMRSGNINQESNFETSDDPMPDLGAARNPDIATSSHPYSQDDGSKEDVRRSQETSTPSQDQAVGLSGQQTNRPTPRCCRP